uniref:Uncharacterized protein n=1 Tax=Anopheles atroparvus TaxID=41427 RepID=A0A182IXC7_ANOAO
MPPALEGNRTTRQQVTVPERKPDYFIGSSGLPTLTSPSVKMHHASASSGDGVRNSKLNKCLYNTAIRNGAAGGPGTTGAINVGIRRSCKTESDITAIKPSTTGRYSKSPSSSTTTAATLSSPPGCLQMRGCTVADAGRTTGSPPGGWSSSTTSSSSWRSRSSSSSPSFVMSNSNRQLQKIPCPPPRLLGGRSNVQRTSSTSTCSNRPQEDRLMVSQQCRYSNLQKQLDNRLTYQRSYDRNIFGYDQRMDQFVLPPLQS